MTITSPLLQKPPGRMALGAITKGKVAQPLRVLLYGVEGIGKSSFAAGAPAPIFLAPEDGTAHLDVHRFPEPQTWADVLDAVRMLEHEQHEYKTLVLDTVDWLEPLCWRQVCEQARKPDIEAFGFGKGYVAALDVWRGLLVAMDGLRRVRGMHVVLLGHALVRTFKNPEGPDYDRYNLKLHDKAGGLLKEWSDAVLFANYQTLVDTDGTRPKGLGGGARMVYTGRRAAYDAKNRHGLPEKLPLGWGDFAAAVQAGVSPADLRMAIEAKRAQLANPTLDTWLAAKLVEVGDDVTRLAKLDNQLAAKFGLTTSTTQETTTL